MVKLKSYSSFTDIKIDFRKIALIILSASILAVFLNDRFSTILGPVMTILMCYLFLSDYSEIVTAMILVANDDLGTMVLGKVSFPYLLLVLVIYKISQRKKYTVAEIVFCLVSLVLILELYFSGFLSVKGLIYSVTFVVSLISIGREKTAIDNFFFGVAITVVLIALHACITGGVEFYETVAGSDEFLRKGILGVGIGDSNYSCFLLNIALVCIWCDKRLPIFVKAILSTPVVYAITITLSTAGLIAFLLVVSLCVVLNSKNMPKAIFALLIAAIVLIVIFSIYLGLPKEFHLEQVDAYIERMNEKIDAFTKGDMDAVTTNRSLLSSLYINYILKEPVFMFFFGGNTILVFDTASHNTYIDIVLQVGVLGMLIFLFIVLRRLVSCCKSDSDRSSKARCLTLKALSIFFAFTLSLSSGNLWALWMYFLCCI